MKPGLFASLLSVDRGQLVLLLLLRGGCSGSSVCLFLLLCRQVGLPHRATLGARQRVTGPQVRSVLRVAVQVDEHLVSRLVAGTVEERRLGGARHDAVVPILAIANGSRNNRGHAHLADLYLGVLVVLTHDPIIGIRHPATDNRQRDRCSATRTCAENKKFLHVGCDLSSTPRRIGLPESRAPTGIVQSTAADQG